MRGVLDTTLCDKVCQWLLAGQWFLPGIPVCSANKTDLHDITEILLKGTLSIIISNSGSFFLFCVPARTYIERPWFLVVYLYTVRLPTGYNLCHSKNASYVFVLEYRTQGHISVHFRLLYYVTNITINEIWGAYSIEFLRSPHKDPKYHNKHS